MTSRMAFVIDLKRCIGCDTCAVACKMENTVPLGQFRLRVFDSSQNATVEKPRGRYPDLNLYWVPTMCQHCSDAPCVEVCPTRALWQRDSDGIIELDKDRCIGCQRCEEVCPYDALAFDEDSGTADKCSACDHRRDRGPDQPMCAMSCPTRAIHFGDLSDDSSKVRHLLSTRPHRVLNESSGARPNIYYLEP